jgi:hypothetical protein
VPRPLPLLLTLLSAIAVAALVFACASGTSKGSSSDAGDDSTLDGPGPTEGGQEDGGEASTPGDGGGTSLSKACTDNVAQYCNQLSTCSSFLLSVIYGDVVTCQTRLGGSYCSNIVSAKGSGWTGDGLESCIAARAKLTCTDFLYLKPQPSSCMPAGTLTTGSCLFSTQCGTGYCRIPAAGGCGNCVQRGTTGAPCTQTGDCDGNLVCSGGVCVAPQPIGGTCSATAPCASGVACILGKCAQPGGVGAACNPDAGGLDCDYNLGAYCSGTSCAAISVGTVSSTCGGSPPTACLGDGTCQEGDCVLPIGDGQPCDGGLNCAVPSACTAGVCATPNASQCP